MITILKTKIIESLTLSSHKIRFEISLFAEN